MTKSATAKLHTDFARNDVTIELERWDTFSGDGTNFLKAELAIRNPLGKSRRTLPAMSLFCIALSNNLGREVKIVTGPSGRETGATNVALPIQNPDGEHGTPRRSNWPAQHLKNRDDGKA